MAQSTCFVFDLDDTLYPERDHVCSGFKAVDSLVSERLGISGFGDACLQSFLRGDRGRIFDAVLHSRFGLADAQLVEDLVRVYRSHAPHIDLYPDARRFLDRARRLALPMALITDGPRESQWAKIEALSLTDAFSPIVVTAELGDGKSKPHPAAFEQVQRTVAPARRFVYIADNPGKDFLAPNQLGWLSVRIVRADGLYAHAKEPTPLHAAQHSVSSLDEVWQVR
jgi:putative hydrolase of the HAD superfamily